MHTKLKFLVILFCFFIIFISGCARPEIPEQKGFEIFENKNKALDFFRNFKSEKSEEFESSASIAIQPKKVCETTADCLLVSNYYTRPKVNCKIDPEAPGDWMACPEEGGFTSTYSSADSTKGFMPELGDPRYQWGTNWFTDCVNPLNLEPAEREGLEIENSITRKCSCLTLAEYYGGEGENNGVPDNQIGPPVPSEENDSAEESDTYRPPTKYCMLLKKTADLIISDIAVPGTALEKGLHSFEVTIKNIGSDKCCEMYQTTEFYKNGEDLGGLGLHMTFECWAFPDGKGILPDETMESGTGIFNFTEAGTYTIESNVKCTYPEEADLDNGVFEAQVQIK